MNFNPNSGFLFVIATIVIAFVIAQSVFFLIRSYRHGVAIGMDKDKFKTCFSSQRAMVERAYPGAFDFLDNGWDFLIMMTGLFALYFLVLRNKIEGMLPKVGTEDFDFGGQIKQLGKNIWSIPNQIAKAVGKAMDEKVI